MNNRIRQQNIEDLLFYDIETVSRKRELEIGSREYDLFKWKNRDRTNGRTMTDIELSLLYKQTAALSPVFNKVVCISVAYVKDTVLYYRSFTGDEKDIITSFYKILNTGNYTPAGFNVIGFDAPLLRIKALQCGVEVDLLDRYSDAQKKPWDMSKYYMDLMEAVKGTYFYNLSLDEVCYLTGVESPKNALKGDGVTEAYYNTENGLELIQQYCERDTVACVEVFLAFQNKRGLITTFVDRNDDNVEIKDERSPLEKLYTENQLTESIKLELETVLKKKKPTKKDKIHLINMIHTLSVNSEMFKSDKPDVVKEKLIEAEEFINKL